jgi:hypothetical protein
MNWIRMHRPSPATAIALAALFVALGGVAFAAIPDSNGTIHGCFKNENGNLRVVDSSAGCRASETSIQWNQQGPSKVRTFGDVRLTDGESRDLVTAGPLTLTAICRLNFAPFPNFPDFKFDRARVLASTSEDHAAFGGTQIGAFSNGIRGGDNANRDLLTTTPEEGRYIVTVPTRVDVPDKAAYQSVSFSAAAPDGTHLSGVLDAAVDALGTTGCVFGGHVVATP